MKLVVFGASGKCGAQLVRLAEERGHDVVAVVRASTPFEARQVLRGDVLDAAFVAGAVRGRDAVASALGMRYAHPFARRESPDDFTSRATANLVAAMKGAGVRRVSVISAAGVGDSRPAMNWPMRLMLRVSNVGVAYADLERVEALLRDSGLDWQAVRPVTLTNRPRMDRVKLVSRYAATAAIPRGDVAAFMLRELERGEFSARTPMLQGAG